MQIIKKWTGSPGAYCNKSINPALSFTTLLGVFSVLGVGILCSMLVALLERSISSIWPPRGPPEPDQYWQSKREKHLQKVVEALREELAAKERTIERLRLRK